MNEEFFDVHPRPYDVQYFELENLGRLKITLYIDHNNPETFLLKTWFSDWKEAERWLKVMTVQLQNTGIDVYRDRKYLFLRKLLF